jgi:hypothetical protein
MEKFNNNLSQALKICSQPAGQNSLGVASHCEIFCG